MVRTPLSLRRIVLPALTAAALACSLHTTGLGDAPAVNADAGVGASSVDATTANEEDGAPSTGEDAASSGVDAGHGGGGDDDETDAWVNPDALILDPDATFESDGGEGGTVDCDRDQDGHRAAGSTCAGDDCCDYDGRAFPGEQAFFETPDACGSFDYDCDGKTNPKFTTEACKLGFFDCSGDGFAVTTACGTTSDFVSCAFAVFSCNQDKKPRIQPCR